MKKTQQTMAFNALSQPNRLALFTAISNSDDGLNTTDAAKAAGTLINTATVNLTLLEAAGLIDSTRKGRSVIHRAKPKAVKKLAQFLLDIVDGKD
ncbi:MAG: helix-turn-helix domain-containing protein [Pontixanthobacter sp.]